jgi:chorismate-pyruvate lyase
MKHQQDTAKLSTEGGALPDVEHMLQADAADALASLCAGFVLPERSPIGAHVVSADVIPTPYSTLLDHNDHMTTTLEQYHGRPIELRVLESRIHGDRYDRKILLTAGTDRFIEFGIVHMDLGAIPPAAREEIERKSAPLGDVLIRHNVLRRIEPKWFLRFGQDSFVFEHLEGEEAYGRIGTIHVEGRPVIRLLEVVVA